MNFTNFTEDETETLVLAADMFLDKYFPDVIKIDNDVFYEVINILSSRTFTNEDFHTLGLVDNELADTLNLYRNPLCFFIFRNLYLMHYGKHLLEMKCPVGAERNYGLTMLRSDNAYKIKYDRLGGKELPTLWPDNTGHLEWVPEGFTLVPMSKIKVKGTPTKVTPRKKSRAARKAKRNNR